MSTTRAAPSAWSSSLLSREAQGTHHRRRPRRICADRGGACARRREQAAAVACRRARQCAEARLVRQLRAAGAAVCSARATFADIPIAELVDYIDWSPFFATWELNGKYPAILDDAKVGEAARSLFADAQAMLRQMADEQWFRASAVIGFWPANSDGDDIAGVRRRSAQQADRDAAHAAPAAGAPRGPRQCRARRFRRAARQRACRLYRRLRGDRRHRRGRGGRALQARQ